MTRILTRHPNGLVRVLYATLMATALPSFGDICGGDFQYKCPGAPKITCYAVHTCGQGFGGDHLPWYPPDVTAAGCACAPSSCFTENSSCDYCSKNTNSCATPCTTSCPKADAGGPEYWRCNNDSDCASNFDGGACQATRCSIEQINGLWVSACVANVDAGLYEICDGLDTDCDQRIDNNLDGGLCTIAGNAGGLGGEQCVGDPVLTGQGSSYSSNTDLTVRFANGSFSIDRMYRSVLVGWTEGSMLTQPIEGSFLPTPYGYSPRGKKSLEWWNSLYSFVSAVGSDCYVRDEAGALYRYDHCSVPLGDTKSTQTQFFNSGGGTFTMIHPDGRKLLFGAPWKKKAGIATDRVFLSKVSDSAGHVLARITYGTPNVSNCTGGLIDGGYGAPYITRVDLGPDGGTYLQMRYASLPQTNGDLASECVLRGIDMYDLLDGGTMGMRSVVEYAYLTDAGTEAAGRISSVTYPSGRVVGYAYSPGSVWTIEGGLVINNHSLDGGTVGQIAYAQDLHGNYSWVNGYTWGTAFGSTCGTLACCSVKTGTSQTALSTLKGDGSATTAQRVTTWEVVTTPVSTSPRITARTETANGIARNTKWDLACVNYDKETENFVEHPRGDRTTYTWRDGGYLSSMELTSAAVGADNSGGSPLETTRYEYEYSAERVQRVKRILKPSVLAGDDAGVEFRYDSAGQLVAMYQFGHAQMFDGTTPARVIAHFYAQDGGLLLSETGPCDVSSTSATSCTGTFRTRTFEYYTAADGPLLANRLKAVRRPGGSYGSLDTTYDAYDARGNVLRFTDENGVATNIAYLGDKVASRSVALLDGGTVAWNYTWENDKLTSIGFPEGNFEVFCYRSGGLPTCTGSWTGRLQWRAKASASNGGTLAEAITYTYSADGELQQEQYVEGDGGVRRSISHQKDPLGRETWTSYGGVVEKRGYDRNDNLVAIGIPYNGTAGDFCGVGSSSPDAPTDTKCTSLGYDRADRISQVKEFYSGSNVTVRAATC